MIIKNIQTFGFEKAADVAYPKHKSNYYSEIVWNEQNKIDYDFLKHPDYDFYFDKKIIETMQVNLDYNYDEPFKYIIVQGEMQIQSDFLIELLSYDKESTYNVSPLFLEYGFKGNDFGFDTYKKNWDLPLNDANDIRWMQLDIETYCKMVYDKFIETNNYLYYRALCDITPNAKLRKVYFTSNYATLRKLYFKISHIKEWKPFIDFMRELPYGEELILYQGEEG